MSGKHTPGPWVVGENRQRYDIVIRNKSHDPVAAVFIAGYNKTTSSATAHLIAAAPELLAACKDLYHEMSALHDMPARKRHILKATREAITKAEPPE